MHETVEIEQLITDRCFKDGSLIKIFGLDDNCSKTFPRS